MDDAMIVKVRRQWNDWRIGSVPLGALRGFHWREFSRGVSTPSPRPILYARMWCDALVDGDIAHSCEYGAGPHEILVCIIKKDNVKSVIAEVQQRAEKGAENYQRQFDTKA